MFCKNCGEYLFMRDNCRCKLFEVVDEHGEEYQQYGYDEEDAAIKFARKSNEENEYYLMNDSVEIQVNGIKFSISAEPDVHYSATKI